MRHVYSVIRYVPNTASGERVNIGLLAGSEDTREWTLQTVNQKTRARQLGGDALPGVIGYLEWLTADLEKYTEAHAGGQISLIEAMEDHTEHWIRELANQQRGAVQFSQPQPVDADSAQAAIDLLWDNLLVDRESRRFAFTKKNTAQGAVRQALRKVNIKDENLWTAALLDSSGYSAPVDFAVHNGSVAFLTNCWSFQIPDKDSLLTDIQSWAWTVRSLRSKGGMLSVQGEDDCDHSVPKDVGLSIVYVPPVTNEDRDAFEKAAKAFSDPAVKAHPIVPWEEASAIVAPALDALSSVQRHS